MHPRLRALLATARIANVPSVVCNVITGMLLMIFFDGFNLGWNKETLNTIASACCLYIAGNFLNDWYDVVWDQNHRPERAIPSGLFRRDQYLGIALGLIFLGGLIAWDVSKTLLLVYALILGLVIAYTLLHKRHAYSIWIMGGCRAGLYLMGLAVSSRGFGVFSDFFDSWFPWQAIGLSAMILSPLLGMLCYIAGISLLARHESAPVESPNIKFLASTMLMAPLLTHVCCLACSYLYFATEVMYIGFLFGTLPFFLWTLWTITSKKSVPVKVSRMLAGIALVDSIYWWTGGFCLHHYFPKEVWIYFTIPLLAFLSSLALQKIAPAT